MTRRARITWLLDDTAPTGRTVMALRRMAVLATRHPVAGFALNATAGSAGGRLGSARSLAGEARLARSDIVVSASTDAAASAAARMSAGTRLIHFVHQPADAELAKARFMQSVPRMSRVVVPMAFDTSRFAGQIGLPAANVVAMDDFVLEAESLPGRASAPVAMIAGRIEEYLLDVVEGFRLADLPDWQLRILGTGPALPALAAHVETAGLGERVLLLGGVRDLAPHYAAAGVVLSLNPAEANGLSVLESLAAGVPVLGDRRVPAVQRLVRDGHDGVVLDRTDPVAIAEGIRRIAGSALRAELAANARAGRQGLLTATAVERLHRLVADTIASPAPSGGMP